MKTKLLTLLVLVLFSFTSKAQMSAYLADTLDALFHQRADLLKMKGIGASVVFPDGSVWTATHGNKGTDSLTPDLLFEIGSNTKSMTAAAVLLLVEEGKLSLEDSIGMYLPPIKNMPGNATIRQVLAHTSGMATFELHPDFYPFVNQNWTSRIDPDSVLYKYLDVPNFKPGAKWAYSNSGYTAAGLIIEKVSGMSYQQFLREKLFDRLGLGDTYLSFYERYATENHVGVWWPDGTYDSIPSTSFLTAAWAAGGVIATPADFGRWCQSLFGGQLLKSSSLQEMTDTKPTGTGWNYGLGVMKRSYKGRDYYSHGGTTLQHSAMEYSIESDFSVAVIGIETDKAGQPVQMANFLIDLMESELPNVPVTFLGEDELTDSQLTLNVYPNPAVDQVTIETSQERAAQISVYSTSGELIYETYSDFGRAVLLREELGSGMFIARVINPENGQVFHNRFLFK
ncbi:serine hydrolase [bacterium SCSIO 12741]|nr:serine hydrolase [bacterium SCSIO 12741]